MGSLNYIKGDLIKTEARVIVHGCNCFCNMGSGVAKAIKLHFPEAFQADQETTRGDKKKLGTISYAESKGKLVVNAYTQHGYGHQARQIKGKSDLFEYRKFVSCLAAIRELTSEDDTIAFPKIGAGLAGGDWDKIEEMIRKGLHDRNVLIHVI